MNVYKFPFDLQTCSIVVGSWTLPIQLIQMNYNYFLSSSGYISNSIWTLQKNINIFVQNTTRLSSQYLASDIYFQGTVQRKPMHYVMNNVYPCLILNVITLYTFTFPFALQASLSKYTYNYFISFQ
jgi:hypothetical protein